MEEQKLYAISGTAVVAFAGLATGYSPESVAEFLRTCELQLNGEALVGIMTEGVLSSCVEVDVSATEAPAKGKLLQFPGKVRAL